MFEQIDNFGINTFTWACGAIGSAAALHAEGYEFESRLVH